MDEASKALYNKLFAESWLLLLVFHKLSTAG